ncbi:uncharacterized protein METZ01_LOCUS150409 [marine metagenome]|uniref:Uncharacterized protein n=1 Tax=marine metagenome TaxID=408172 RepID=A0A382A7N5_9ZZZZ
MAISFFFWDYVRHPFLDSRVPNEMGWSKGFFACVLGAVLYATVPKAMQLLY